MLRPNRLTRCVAAALLFGLIGACGGGGDDAQIPDVASHNGRVDEPQTPIRNEAVLASLRLLPALPEELKKDMPGLNATIHLLLHNPAWGQKVMNIEMAKAFPTEPAYQKIVLLIAAFRNGLGLEKPHAEVVKEIGSLSTDDETTERLREALQLMPTNVSAIEERLGRGETIFIVMEDDRVAFDQLPAQDRIIGVAVEEGENEENTDHVAYLKKGTAWYGTNDERFSKVNLDYIKRVGKDVKSQVTAVSYSAN